MKYSWEKNVQGVSACMLALLAAVSARPHAPHLGFSPRVNRFVAGDAFNAPRPGTPNCTERFFTQTLDHFAFNPPPAGSDGTFQQRYFICDLYWKRPNASHVYSGGPLFFYTGNEANVELYVNATGLMWESAPEMGALMVFAEHRYFGKTKPFGSRTESHMGYLTTEQALADYSVLAASLKRNLSILDTPIIGFGGSYGGMLATWWRIKYPHVVQGVIAGSAPIWSFLGERPGYDTDSYAHVETLDAIAAGGSPSSCSTRIRRAWQRLFNHSTSVSGLARIGAAFKTCAPVPDAASVTTLAYWAQSAFDYMAMGDYPYPSSYILNGDGMLPAFPMRAACDRMVGEVAAREEQQDHDHDHDVSLLRGLRDAVGVYYNHTGSLPCFNYTAAVNPDSDEDARFWDFLFCTEMFQPMSRSGIPGQDMFWAEPFEMEAQVAGCKARWGVTPRADWATVNYGGKAILTASNILFSNGHLGPWSGGGVLSNLSSSLRALVIQDGAHHLDLMWSNPRDPPDVVAARDEERRWIRKWVEESHFH